jgi:hypothetical protein
LKRLSKKKKIQLAEEKTKEMKRIVEKEKKEVNELIRRIESNTPIN